MFQIIDVRTSTTNHRTVFTHELSLPVWADQGIESTMSNAFFGSIQPGMGKSRKDISLRSRDKMRLVSLLHRHQLNLIHLFNISRLVLGRVILISARPLYFTIRSSRRQDLAIGVLLVSGSTVLGIKNLSYLQDVAIIETP